MNQKKDEIMQSAKIAIFKGKQIRKTLHNNEWWFVVNDVVQVLTDTPDAKDYIRKMRDRDNELGKGWGQIVTPLLIETPGGKQKLNCADTEGLLRIIQSIPSPKAEPFKMWLAKVGYERIEETEDPELAFDRAMATYLKKGYSSAWINQRLKSIEVRKELTDEWKDRGVQEGLEFAILTDEITKAWSGLTTKEYKKLKDLKKENLRDNMTNLELVINMLAEASTTEISKEKNPTNFEESQKIANIGGTIAGNTRKEIEKESGKSIVTPLNAKTFLENKNNKVIDDTEKFD
jgi:hypothetical protein